MITPEKAEQDYEEAIAILGQIATAPESTSVERTTARSAAAELTFKYLGQIEMEVSALTAQYREFITSMNDLVVRLQGSTTPIGAINALTKIVHTGAQLIGLATGAAPSGARAFGRQKAVSREPARSTAGALKILCVHGVGHQEKDPAFEGGWREAITNGIGQWSLSRPLEIEFVDYDQLFARASLSSVDLAEAVFKLSASGLVHGIGDFFFRKPRGLSELSDSLRWTAGMVAQWAENDELREGAGDAVREHIVRFKPDAILAHSLGSLICYDLFNNPGDANLLKDRVFVTFGSQIGNPFVRDALGGRIDVIEPANRWFHLYNVHDDAFAAPLRMRAENFRQVLTEFDIPGMLDHDALHYLGHANTRASVWRYLAQGQAPAGARALGISAEVIQKQATLARKTRLQSKPAQRALLIGINDYPDPANRLEGCVNDVFLMSSVLQECGFEAEDIRVVLNERATAKGVLERMDWLLDGADDGQHRVLFYSGHGAQLPGYGAHEKADRVDECLVTYDFDWSREHAVTDDQFYELYSQLPDKANFLAVFDCCHSGGLTRDSGLRARGLNPPDDIRHRALRWNVEAQMWESRKEVSTESKAATEKKGALAVNKLGHRSHEKAKTAKGSKAYRPILMQACQEKQFSYEYRHGVTAYGAFTYSLSQIFKKACQDARDGRRKKLLTWNELTHLVAQRLKKLEYDQKPALVCPTKLANAPIPWYKK
jgi:hypothetical protein